MPLRDCSKETLQYVSAHYKAAPQKFIAHILVKHFFKFPSNFDNLQYLILDDKCFKIKHIVGFHWRKTRNIKASSVSK